jgi:hypothetical protein
VDRECTRHNWCTLGKITKCSEIDPSLLELNSLPLALVLIVLTGALALIRLLGLRAFSNKVIRIPTNETTIRVARTKGW